MSQAWAEGRLTMAESRIDDLEKDARGSAEDKSRIDHHVEALRKAHASARAAARHAHGRFDDAFQELSMRLRIAEHRRAAEVAGSRGAFVRAVEAELQDWDDYLDRRQSGATQTDVSADELRDRRNEVASQLGDLSAAPEGVWRERRDRVLDALDELDRSAGTA